MLNLDEQDTDAICAEALAQRLWLRERFQRLEVDEGCSRIYGMLANVCSRMKHELVGRTEQDDSCRES
jgi:hypothetical protein